MVNETMEVKEKDLLLEFTKKEVYTRYLRVLNKEAKKEIYDSWINQIEGRLLNSCLLHEEIANMIKESEEKANTHHEYHILAALEIINKDLKLYYTKPFNKSFSIKIYEQMGGSLIFEAHNTKELFNFIHENIKAPFKREA